LLDLHCVVGKRGSLAVSGNDGADEADNASDPLRLNKEVLNEGEKELYIK
jgi:hypothetical protein